MTKRKRTARTRAMQAGRRNYRRWRAVLREAREPRAPQFLTAATVRDSAVKFASDPSLSFLPDVMWVEVRSEGVDEFLKG